MDSTKKTRQTSNAIFMTVLVAMFAAIGAVTSWISIPTPFGVPITLQTFGMALIGYTLGYKYGTLSVAVYIVLGAVGVPVFSSFKAGFGVIIGITGGFIVGFLLMAPLCGLNHIKPIKNANSAVKAVLSIVFGVVGLLLCYLFGVAQMSLISGNSFWASAIQIITTCIVKDVISVVVAYFVSLAAISLIKKISKRDVL